MAMLTVHAPRVTWIAGRPAVELKTLLVEAMGVNLLMVEAGYLKPAGPKNLFWICGPFSTYGNVTGAIPK